MKRFDLIILNLLDKLNLLLRFLPEVKVLKDKALFTCEMVQQRKLLADI